MLHESMIFLLLLSDPQTGKPKDYTDIAAAQKKTEETPKPRLLHVFDSRLLLQAVE